jgi:hypothetical protein
MIHKLIVQISLVVLGLNILSAQQDRVIRLSYTLGEATYFLSFENGGGGELVTQKTSLPDDNETFFLKSVGADSSGNGLFLISSLTGYFMRTDGDKQLIADQKEVCVTCFFHIAGDTSLTIRDSDGWMLQFSKAEAAFVMTEVSPINGKTPEDLQAAGLSLNGADIPGGIEGIGLFRTFPGFDELKGQFPKLLKGFEPPKPEFPFQLIKPQFPTQPDQQLIKPSDLQIDPIELKENKLKKNNWKHN